MLNEYKTTTTKLQNKFAVILTFVFPCITSTITINTKKMQIF